VAELQPNVARSQEPAPSVTPANAGVQNWITPRSFGGNDQMDRSSLMLVRDANVPAMSSKEEHVARSCLARSAAFLGFRLEEQEQRGR